MMNPSTWGSVKRSVLVDGILVSQTRHSSDCALPRHAHVRPTMNVVLAGEYGERTSAGEAVHGPGTLIVHPAEEPHSNFFDHSDAVCLLLEFEPETLRRIDPDGGILEEPGVFTSLPIGENVLRLMGLLAEGIAERTAADEATELLALLPSARRADDEPPPPWLLETRERIEDECPRRIALSELAVQADVTPTHLCERFHAAFGTTISNYLEKRRLEIAVQELVNGDTAIGEIALSAGFYDHSHFARVFRRATRLTPSRFREVFGA